ncbi:MAG TPA: CvpA family protein [Blastocatellia bacterium]|nr:CvpA family protein [Blastocatellia bacterium]
MALNFIDLLLILIVLLGALLGWYRGFLLGVFDLARWVGSMLLALRLYQPVASLIGPRADWPGAWDQPAAFILILIVTGVLIHFVEYQILRRLPARIHQSRTNRLAGILPGLVNGLILAAIAAPVLLAIPLPDGLRATARESALTNRLAVVTDRLEAALTPVIEEAVGRRLNLRTVRPESDELLKLPFTVADPKPRPDLEARMLELVNRERAAAGLAALAPDAELTEVARRHSTDMFVRGYFSHITPEGRSPFDRMRATGVRFLAAGENLALAPTLTIAHNGLMNSPGHRANILRPSFGRVGIGIMDGGRRGLMITQNFRN